MDDPHLVRFRVTLKSVPMLRLKFGDHWRVLRNVEGTFMVVFIPDGWVILSGMKGSPHVPLSICEGLWDDLMAEVEIDFGKGWKMTESWREINAAQAVLPKAAE